MTLVWEPPTTGSNHLHAFRAKSGTRSYWVRRRAATVGGYRLLIFDGDSLVGAADHPDLDAAKAAADAAEQTAATA